MQKSRGLADFGMRSLTYPLSSWHRRAHGHGIFVQVIKRERTIGKDHVMVVQYLRSHNFKCLPKSSYSYSYPEPIGNTPPHIETSTEPNLGEAQIYFSIDNMQFESAASRIQLYKTSMLPSSSQTQCLPSTPPFPQTLKSVSFFTATIRVFQPQSSSRLFLPSVLYYIASK